MGACEQRVQQEMEERERDLAEKVLKATFDQCRLKFEGDLEVLQKLAPTQRSQAEEANKDATFLRKRQQNLGLI